MSCAFNQGFRMGSPIQETEIRVCMEFNILHSLAPLVIDKLKSPVARDEIVVQEHEPAVYSDDFKVVTLNRSFQCAILHPIAVGNEFDGMSSAYPAKIYRLSVSSKANFDTLLIKREVVGHAVSPTGSSENWNSGSKEPASV